MSMIVIAVLYVYMKCVDLGDPEVVFTVSLAVGLGLLVFMTAVVLSRKKPLKFDVVMAAVGMASTANAFATYSTGGAREADWVLVGVFSGVLLFAIFQMSRIWAEANAVSLRQKRATTIFASATGIGILMVVQSGYPFGSLFVASQVCLVAEFLGDYTKKK